MAKASFVAWPSASSGCCSYHSTPVTSQFCDAEAVRLIELSHHHIRDVDWNRLFLVIGLAGLDTCNVQTTLFSVDAENSTGQRLVVALAAVALATVSLVATGDLNLIAL